eukprot:Amastigsp_a519896_11.p5 type:complete len:122 gc:universal Amastigsp_a519896_11:563-198(-)
MISSSGDRDGCPGRTSRNTEVMMQCSALRARCAASASASDTLATTSPYTSTKSDVMSPSAKMSRSAAPAEFASEFARGVTLIGHDGESHRDEFKYSATCSACETLKTITSLTPAVLRNSIV